MQQETEQHMFLVYSDSDGIDDMRRCSETQQQEGEGTLVLLATLVCVMWCV